MQPAITSIKEKLHQAIECIDDEKILEAIYTILGSYRNEAEDYELTDEQLKELEKKEAEHLSGKTKSYGLEEHIQMTKEKYGF
ncbi:MAG: hypothetical protein ABIS01_06645 [Ferruginibacter sp.]